VDVLVPVAVDTAYSYAVPVGLALAAGDIVEVPLGTRRVLGVVWQGRSGGAGNLKSVIGRMDLPPVPDGLRRFIDWVAWYTLAARGSVLALALKTPDDSRPLTAKVGVRLASKLPQRMTPARSKVIAAATDGLVRGKRELALLAGVSLSVVDGLVDEGALEALALAPEPVAALPNPDHAPPSLSPEQARAVGLLCESVRGAHAGVTLVEGVTGSGKTEVYFEAVAQCVRQGRQALVMMPEIALTSQFVARFAARFGVEPGLWHSGIGQKKRERLYAAVAAGEAKVVIGARSALFLPYAQLGLVIVDEEHEGAYKQEDGVTYHARDMAVARGHIEQVPVVLASATPSIETRVNVARGRYDHVVLPERFGGRVLPQIRAIDLRLHRPARGRYLAGPLVSAIEANLAAGEQSLLFLNRRGYAPLTLCEACGHRWQCPNCTAWLVEHRFRRALVCHHCGHVERRPDHCAACGAVDSLVACGPGVERICEEVAERFPQARTIALSSDFPGGAQRLQAEFEAIAAGEAQIVIGTQLVAKGHNFPLMTLVGVVDADIGLNNGDPRAAERSFQLIQQVAGRAGRGDKPGRALIQTHQPDHPVMAALVSGDAERFLREEIALREAAGLPPFGRLAALIVSGADQGQTQAHARALARVAEAPAGIVVLGPAEAPIAMIRGRHRQRLIVRARREIDLQAFLRGWIGRAPRPTGSVRVQVDIDPMSFL
jgi:primosomal protein N' (replication factor Y)